MDKPALRSGKAELIHCGPSFLRKKYETIIDDVVKSHAKKSGAFLTLLGIYSIGVKMTLKVELTPMETTLRRG